MRATIGTLFGILAIVLLHAEDARPQQLRLRRWAVIADPAVSATGLADLLTAELSELPGVQLVERQELDRVTRELELAAVLGAEGTRQRLQLGKRLKADALLLLTASKDRKSARIVVAECRFGVRLEADGVSLQQIDDAAERIRKTVAAVRERFGDGVRQVIAVTPFLSSHLTRRYDHLQVALASLLADSLRQYPGVATVEISEAHAIGRELATFDAQLKRRLATAFIGGELTIAGSPGEESYSLAVQRILGQRQEAVAVLDCDSLDDLIAEIRAELPAQILKDEARPRGRRLSVEDQRQSLADRARRFALTASYLQAADLREAALLLRPSDIGQRAHLVADYRLAVYDRWMEHRGEAARESVELEIFRRAVPHATLLVKSGRLSRADGAWMLEELCRCMATYNSRKTAESRREVGRLFWEVIADIGGASRKQSDPACHQGLERLIQRPRRPLTAEQSMDEWVRVAVMTIVYYAPRADRFFPGMPLPKAADELRRLWRHPAVAATPSAEMLAQLRPGTQTRITLNSSVLRGSISAQAAQQLFTELAGSESPLLRYYGEFAKLSLKLTLGKEKPTEGDARQLAALGRLAKSIDGGAKFHAYTRMMEAELRKALSAGQMARSRPAGRRSYRPIADPVGAPSESSRVVFGLCPELSPEWLEVFQADDETDIVWSQERVAVIERSGGLRELLRVQRPSAAEFNRLPLDQRSQLDQQITEVASDGRRVWIATAVDGIFAVTLDGRQQVRFGRREGLPNYDQKVFSRGAGELPSAVKLHPVSQGRCLAVGTFGSQRRMWFAMLAVDARGKPVVKVFHEATHLPASQRKASDDLEGVFQSRWIAGVKVGAKEKLLMGRESGRRALVVDPEALTVSLDTIAPPPSGYRRIPPLPVPGGLLFGQQLLIRSPLGWEIKEHGHYSGSPPHLLAPRPGVAHVVDSAWTMVDTETLRFSDLLFTLPRRYRFERMGVSAHYGMVAWNQDDLMFQVRVHERPRPQQDHRRLHVDPAKQEPHRRAVKAIEDLGGKVGVVFGKAGVTRELREMMIWGRNMTDRRRVTFVYLDHTWRGAPGDLQAAGGLSGPVAIICNRAPVTDEDLESIKGLQGEVSEVPVEQYGVPAAAFAAAAPRGDGLMALLLIETQVSDDGLRALGGMRHLRYLCLRGSERRPLGDGCVTHLGGLPLEQLILQGRGFTAKALETVAKTPTMRRLAVVDTEVSPQDLATLRRSLPALQVSLRW